MKSLKKFVVLEPKGGVGGSAGTPPSTLGGCGGVGGGAGGYVIPDAEDRVAVLPRVDVRRLVVGPSSQVAALFPRDARLEGEVRHEDPKTAERLAAGDVGVEAAHDEEVAVPAQRLGAGNRHRSDARPVEGGRAEEVVAAVRRRVDRFDAVDEGPPPRGP